MGDSSIEWTDKTWQVTAGCTKVSPGCKHCYAETMAGRLAAMAVADEEKGRNPGRKAPYKLVVHNKPGRGRGGYGPKSGWNNKVVTLPHNLTIPLGWKNPSMIFVNSESDLFHEDVPFEFIDKVCAVMALCPQHKFQMLTKRVERMAQYFDRFTGQEFDGTVGNPPTPRFSAEYMASRHYRIDQQIAELAWEAFPVERSRTAAHRLLDAKLDWKLPLPNVWLGTSVENQEQADERIPHLLQCPAAVRFLSCEPLLGPVNLTQIGGTACLASAGACCGDRPWLDSLRGIQGCRRAGAYGFPLRNQMPRGIDWVIVGGESGPGARPMHPDWARSIRDQCQAAGVAFFFKQWGEHAPFAALPADTKIRGHTWDNGGSFTSVARVGKKAAGRLLDGREWNEMPTPAAVKE